MNNRAIINGHILWDYLSSFRQEEESDIIVVCCSYDLRVCDYACDLYKRTNVKKILFSGKRGNWTRDLWSKTEAEIFKDRAIENGINYKNIIIEDEATNLGENINYSMKFLDEYKRITFVSKSNTLLRVKLTIPKHITGVSSYVSGPLFSFPDEISNIVGINGIINEMVGDIERIIKYPNLGFQEEHILPSDVLESYQYLIDQGFVEHLIK